MTPSRQEPFSGHEDERQRVSDEVSRKLRTRGVDLTGQETSEELVDLLEAVEQFERSVERLRLGRIEPHRHAGTIPPHYCPPS